MKKIWLIILFSIPFFIYGSTWTADVKVALEMQNNLTNTGRDGYTFTNNGSIPFSSNSLYIKYGGFSIGPITGSEYISSDTSITQTIQTIQMWVFMPSAGESTINIMAHTPNNEVIIYLWDGGLCYDSVGYGQIGPFTHWSLDALHLLTMNYDGSHVDFYIDGFHEGQLTCPQFGTSTESQMEFGNRDAGESYNGYFNQILYSTVNSAGAEITPQNAPSATFTPTINITLTEAAQTSTAGAIATETATVWTPTVNPTIPTPCLNNFVMQLTPVLVPTTTYEQQSVGEPYIFNDPALPANEQWLLTYSCNAFVAGGLHETIGLATSSTMYGPWTRKGTTPVIGGGYGGVAGNARMSSMYIIGGQLRTYFQHNTNGGVDYDIVTYDGGLDQFTYTYVTTEAVLSAAWDPYCPGGEIIDGMGIVFDGSSYWALTEVQTVDRCTGQSYPAYVMWLLKGWNDLADQFNLASAVALTDLQYPPGALYAGGKSTTLINSTYHTWLHNDVPSDLYHAVSSDKFNWKINHNPVATPFANEFGLTNCNQTADASFATDGLNCVLYLDGTDNVNSAGRISYMLHSGNANTIDTCFNPTPTPTFTLTVNITPTPTITQTVTLTPTPTFTATPTFTVTPQAVVTISASTTMILGQQYTVNLNGLLIGNFMSSEERFLYSQPNFNLIGQTPTPSSPNTYYNDGPKNGTYSESVSIQLIPLTPGNYNLFGDYITYLANGNSFNNYNSLNITVITATPTYTPTQQSTASNTPNWTATPTNTPIIILTSTFTPTITATWTASKTPTITKTPTGAIPTITPTFSNTPTSSATQLYILVPYPTKTATAFVFLRSKSNMLAVTYRTVNKYTLHTDDFSNTLNISANANYFVVPTRREDGLLNTVEGIHAITILNIDLGLLPIEAYQGPEAITWAGSHK